MGSTRVGFLLNVRLTAFKNQIQGKLDFYSETTSHVSSGKKCRFFAFSRQRGRLPTRVMELSPPTAAVNVVGAVVGGTATHCPPRGSPPQMSREQEKQLHRRAPNKRPDLDCFNNSNGKKRVFLCVLKTASSPVICYPNNPQPYSRVSSHGGRDLSLSFSLRECKLSVHYRKLIKGP